MTRERIVGNRRSSRDATRINIQFGGGSSSSFKRLFAASTVILSAASMTHTLWLESAGAKAACLLISLICSIFRSFPGASCSTRIKSGWAKLCSARLIRRQDSHLPQGCSSGFWHRNVLAKRKASCFLPIPSGP